MQILRVDASRVNLKKDDIIWRIKSKTAHKFATHQLLSIFEDFSFVAIDVKFGEKSLGFVCRKTPHQDRIDLKTGIFSYNTRTKHNISKSKPIQTFFGLIIRHVLRRFLLSVDETACEASCNMWQIWREKSNVLLNCGCFGTWQWLQLHVSL